VLFRSIAPRRASGPIQELHAWGCQRSSDIHWIDI